MPRKFILFLLLIFPQFVAGQSVTGPQHSSAPLNVTDGITSCYPYSISLPSGTLISCNNGIAITSIGGDAFSSNDNLHNWTQYLGLIQQESSSSTAVATIMFIGDSWTSNHLITSPVRKFLQGVYGYGGYGYITFNQSREAVVSQSGCTVTPAGTWTYTSNAFPYGNTDGIDMTQSVSTDTATPARQTVVCNATTDINLHYMNIPSGGSFTWAIDGGAPTTVSTAAASKSFATVNIPSLTVGTHTIVVTVTVAGAGVELLGVDFQRNDFSGIRVHEIGNGGARVAHYLAMDATIWEAQVTRLNPILFDLRFGVNEMAQDITPTSFETDLGLLIDRIHTAVPNASCLLETPTDVDVGGSVYTMAEYAAAMQRAAITKGCGFINHYEIMGDFALLVSNGLIDGTLDHLTSAGGIAVARTLEAYLTSGLLPNITALGAGSTNFFVGPHAGTYSNVYGAGTTWSSGTNNSSFGSNTLKFLTLGSFNSMFGYTAGYSLTTGDANTSGGSGSLSTENIGDNNSMWGYLAGHNQAGANNNTGNGYQSLYSNISGFGNSGYGSLSLKANLGSYSSALGYNAGGAQTTGGNIYLGCFAGATASTTITGSMIVGDKSHCPINDIYLGSGVKDTSPADVTIHASGGSGSNIGGADLILSGGIGTGNSNGGDIIFNTSDSTSSGSSAQAVTTKMTLKNSGNVGIGSTAPSSLLNIYSASGNGVLDIISTPGYHSLKVDGIGTVGIGTAHPDSTITLDIAGPTTIHGGDFVFNQTGAFNTLAINDVYGGSGQIFAITGNNTGNAVEIGTCAGATPFRTNLDVCRAYGSISNSVTNFNSRTTALTVLNNFSDERYNSFFAPTLVGIGTTVTNASTVYISGPPTGSATINNPAALRIDSGDIVNVAGNIGIGTFSTSAKLDILGTGSKIRMQSPDGTFWSCQPANTTGVLTCI